jgi:hypothetical protein
MKLLDDYFELQRKIFDYFGYVEGWRVLPIDDARCHYWRLEGEGPGYVRFADSEDELTSESGNYYEHEIYTQWHLSQWVYRASGYTLVVVDTNTDGNQLLQVFDNSLERPNKGINYG